MENYFKTEIEQAVDDYRGIGDHKFCDTQDAGEYSEDLSRGSIDLCLEQLVDSMSNRNEFDDLNRSDADIHNLPPSSHSMDIEMEALQKSDFNHDKFYSSLNNQEEVSGDQTPVIPSNSRLVDSYGQIITSTPQKKPQKESETEDKTEENDIASVVEENETEYIVEKIIDKKIGDDGKPQYLVKWENYNASNNTWEPRHNLVGCDNAIERFELQKTENLLKNIRKERLGSVSNKQIAIRSNTRRRIATKSLAKTTTKNLDYQVKEIVGLTRVNNERYFLISLAGSKGQSFIRTSIANVVFPRLVIDFYYKHVGWKQEAAPEF